MRRWAALAVMLAAATVAFADGPPAMAPGSSADGYPPTTHFATDCTSKCEAGRAGATVTHVVFLSSEGGKDASLATEQYDAGKSIHYFVADDGSVADLVPEADTAWYAGDLDYNHSSIGIMVEGFVSTPSSFGDLDYERAGQLVAAITHRYHLPIDADHVLGRGSIPNTTYTGTGPDPAFDLTRLRAVAQAYRDELDPPPPPPPTDSTPTPPPADTTPPVLVLTVGQAARLAPTITAAVSCPAEACSVTGAGTIRVPRVGRTKAHTYRLAATTSTLGPGAAGHLALKLPARLRKAIRKALRAHRRVSATITLTATDSAGNHTTQTRHVRLTG